MHSSCAASLSILVLVCYIGNTHCHVGSALFPGGLFLSQPGLSVRNSALCPCMSRRKIILVGAFHHVV